MSSEHKRIASIARKLYKNEISYDEFVREVPFNESDDKVKELVDLIEHEPKRGGLFGMKEKEHDSYIKEIFEIISEFENEST